MMNLERAHATAAIGRIPSGCFILSVTDDQAATGVLVSWVQQAGFEPLCVSVALKQERYAVQLIDRSGRFLLSVIGEDPSRLFRHFGKGFAPGEDAFAGLDTVLTDYGPGPRECIAHMGCRVIGKAIAGDHLLYIAQVEAGSLGDQTTPYVHLRKSGASY